MQNNSADDGRTVIPRWRSLIATAPWELRSARSVGDLQLSSTSLQDDLARWRSEKSLEAAHDIFSTGLITGEKALIWEGGIQIVSNPDLFDERVLESVKREIRPDTELREIRDNLSRLESNKNYVRSTIRMLKRRIRDYPRDVVTALELSRHYALAGEYEKSHSWLYRAYLQAPNNRLILRAAVQLADISGGTDEALSMIWRSAALKYDPLIQSAEIAAADKAGRGSKVAASAKRRLRGRKSLAKVESELALGVATLESSAGLSEREVFKMVSAGISDPTENALAQAVWLGDQSNRSLSARFPKLNVSDDAFEARANILFEAKQYGMALQAAYHWFNDQPFQAHPLNFICTCAAVYYDEPREAAYFADVILDRHVGDWNAVNSALLLLVEIGEETKALRALLLLEGLARNEVVRAFAKAGRGMFEFRFGDTEYGRQSYLAAISHARSAQRRDLIFTAATFYLIGEARYGSISPKDLGDAIATLDRYVNRVPPSSRHDSTRLWERAKHVISSKYINSSEISDSGDPQLEFASFSSALEENWNRTDSSDYI